VSDVVRQRLSAELFYHEPQQDGVGVGGLKSLVGREHYGRSERIAQQLLWGEVAVGVGNECLLECRRVFYLRTLMARAMTRARVETEMMDCSAIMTLARRVSGIVSVGENATTLVRLT
jgi:hypothetical protein